MPYIYLDLDHATAIRIAADLSAHGMLLSYHKTSQQYFTSADTTYDWAVLGFVLLKYNFISRSVRKFNGEL